MTINKDKLEAALTVIGNKRQPGKLNAAANMLLPPPTDEHRPTYGDLRAAAADVIMDALSELIDRVVELERRPPQVIRYQEGLGP